MIHNRETFGHVTQGSHSQPLTSAVILKGLNFMDASLALTSSLIEPL